MPTPTSETPTRPLHDTTSRTTTQTPPHRHNTTRHNTHRHTTHDTHKPSRHDNRCTRHATDTRCTTQAMNTTTPRTRQHTRGALHTAHRTPAHTHNMHNRRRNSNSHTTIDYTTTQRHTAHRHTMHTLPPRLTLTLMHTGTVISLTRLMSEHPHDTGLGHLPHSNTSRPSCLLSLSALSALIGCQRWTSSETPCYRVTQHTARHTTHKTRQDTTSPHSHPL